jgi:hypothetical protein
MLARRPPSVSSKGSAERALCPDARNARSPSGQPDNCRTVGIFPTLDRNFLNLDDRQRREELSSIRLDYARTRGRMPLPAGTSRGHQFLHTPLVRRPAAMPARSSPCDWRRPRASSPEIGQLLDGRERNSCKQRPVFYCIAANGHRLDACQQQRADSSRISRKLTRVKAEAAAFVSSASCRRISRPFHRVGGSLCAPSRVPEKCGAGRLRAGLVL